LRRRHFSLQNERLTMTQPLSIDSLPHQPPMRWILSAEWVAEGEIRAEAKLPAAGGLGGEISILVGLEALAQAAGVLLANGQASPSAPSEGRLLQVKTAHWDNHSLPVDSPLPIRVKLEGSSAAGLHQFSGSVLSGTNEVLLRAEFYLLIATRPV